MNRDTELAMLAGASYESSRSDVNKIPVPEGWNFLRLPSWPAWYGSERRPQTNIPGRVYWQDSTTGFEAAAYTKGNDVVISFAGTYFEGELKQDMQDNNVPLGLGKVTSQLKQAAEFIARLRRDPAMAGKNITLTGHSLGGGIASLMAVMFDLQAVTFDPAPFRAAATEANAAEINAHLNSLGLGFDAKIGSFTSSGLLPVPVGLPLRLLGPWATAIGSLVGVPNFVFVPTTVGREQNVRAIAAKGEFLTGSDTDASIRDALRVYGGSLTLLDNNAKNVAGSNLHSQSLLALLLEIRDGGGNGGFYSTARAYEGFLSLFFDSKLFDFQRTDSGQRTPLEHILRHHFGVAANNPNGAAPIASDQMLDVMGADLLKLGTPGTGFIAQFQQAVLSSVLRHYYTAVDAASTPQRYAGGSLKQLLTAQGGGVSFLAADVEAPGDTLRSWDQFTKGILSETQTTIPQADNPAYASLVTRRVPQTDRISVATSGALNLAATGDALRDLSLGGDGADIQRTGGGADFIYAGRGNDLLDGGLGNDLLLGGTGTDTYQFTGAFGKDTVIDADGLGGLQIDGSSITTTQGAGRANTWTARLANGQTLGLALYSNPASATGQNLVITRAGSTDNTVTIAGFDLARAQAGGYLGIQLGTANTPALRQAPGNFWQDADANLSQLNGLSATLREGAGAGFTISLSQAARAGDVLTLNLAGLAGQGVQALIDGAAVDAAGARINLTPGQTQVSFALVQAGGLNADAAGALSVSFTGAAQGGASGGTSTSNSFALTLKNDLDAETTLTGDYKVKVERNGGQPIYRYDANGHAFAVVAPGADRYALDALANPVADAAGPLITDNVLYGKRQQGAIWQTA